MKRGAVKHFSRRRNRDVNSTSFGVGFMPDPRCDLHELGRDDLQSELDRLDVIGVWDWDIVANSVRADALVARIFDVDPDLAARGTALSAFIDGIHSDDRERVGRLIEQTSRKGGTYVAEYRVCSADNVERWILARGRFYLNSAGEPTRGRGIVIDITNARHDDDDEMHFYTPVSTRGSAIETLTDHCLAAHSAALDIDNPTIERLITSLLVEVGRELPKDVSRDRAKIAH